MSDIKSCPNCGAPRQGDACPYCGTPFVNVMQIAEGKIINCSFESGGYTYEFKLRIRQLQMHMQYDGYYVNWWEPEKKYFRQPKTEVIITGDAFDQRGVIAL